MNDAPDNSAPENQDPAQSPYGPYEAPYPSPYVPTYAQPFDQSFGQAPPPAPKRHPWRAALAGGVAGGVLAAAVAVPVTLWVVPDNASSGTSAAAPEAPQGGGTFEQPSDGLFPEAGPNVSTEPESTGTKATEEQSQGVVLIDTVLGNGAGAGTGMILTSSGLILTNYHVVEGSTSIKVTDAVSGDTYTGEVVGHDAASDVALVQVDADNLTPIDLDQDGTTLNEKVTAVGNASGQGFLSAVTGTIQAEDQSITASDGEGLGDSEHLTGLLQTDAAVVPGYSGGPLLDADGEVVGIDTAASSNSSTMSALSGTSEGYAVPIDDAMKIVDQIEAGDESGTVQIGPSAYLGVGIGRSGGTQLVEVGEGGPAAEAGLAAGDTITSIDGTSITSYDALKAVLAEHEPGDQVSIEWTGTAGNSHEATVTLGSNPAN
ncbi:S1C family serine protease [Nocardioides sp.]|uniref:S1C family serine protease n=1 Tax=Nocardioides sp. TaxID=35761 RepID=UPI003D1025AE